MDGKIDDAMDCEPQKNHHSMTSHILAKISDQGNQQETAEPDLQFCIASKHALFPVVCATRIVALESLQRKLEHLDQTVREHHRKEIPAMDGDKVTIRLARNPVPHSLRYSRRSPRQPR